ncbi:SGNH/GDSL hydrolase family protein [Alicyclobacillus macrosporangiidus]|uniref:SGNH/GDSL hydrolase family protein n=1 Tax=Alicyclobacillus macrosporangiidus TaxID=392015 RepID=UPI0006910CC5|nr:SGNH/GDSL hydrolase family protein [Alicyclobacillus macrosporangiidus]
MGTGSLTGSHMGLRLGRHAAVVGLVGLAVAGTAGSWWWWQSRCPDTRAALTQDWIERMTGGLAGREMRIPVLVSGRPITVMAVGGSAAYGWHDDGPGYLARAMQALSAQSKVPIYFVNESKVGYGPGKLADAYPGLLQSVQPQVVMIAWGLLNDISHKTPLCTLRSQVRSEIDLALRQHRVVTVVTPPVSVASYTQYRNSEPEYIQNEVEVAESFHSPNVYVVDLFGQMKQYLADHHQTIDIYKSDGWHPNTAGHVLAGQLLAGDLAKVWPVAPAGGG